MVQTNDLLTLCIVLNWTIQRFQHELVFQREIKLCFCQCKPLLKSLTEAKRYQ